MVIGRRAVGSPRTTGLMSKATSCWCQTGAVRPSPSPYSPPPRRPVSPFPAARVGPCLAACVVTAAAWYRGGQKLRRSTPPSAIQDQPGGCQASVSGHNMLLGAAGGVLLSWLPTHRRAADGSGSCLGV